MASCFRVLDREPLCEPCANQDVIAHQASKPAPGWVARVVDPTICARCGTDWGNVELQRIGGSPFCAQCAALVRDFPIPQWVKLSLAATLVLVIIGTVHNLRYFRAIRDVNTANRALESGSFDDADAKMTSAAKMVPEKEDVAHIASFFHGLSLLKKDRSADALKSIEEARGELGEMPLYKQVHAAAMMGVSFEQHDYDAFLSQALGYQKETPSQSYGLAAIASAYACKYAVTGDEQFRMQSLDYLKRAQALPDAPALGDYVDRIQHRLSTREIITESEYHRRFGEKKGAR